MTADVSKREDVAALTATVERELGPIDLLVNNAPASAPRARCRGRKTRGAGGGCSRSTCSGPYLCCRAVLPSMVERGRGRIVNTGSGASYLPLGAPTAYGASKAALGRFGELLAGQVAEFGIAFLPSAPASSAPR